MFQEDEYPNRPQSPLFIRTCFKQTESQKLRYTEEKLNVLKALRENSEDLKLLQNSGKSSVWKYFQLIQLNGLHTNFVLCSRCKGLLLYKKRNGTTGMVYHLKNCSTTSGLISDEIIKNLKDGILEFSTRWICSSPRPISIFNDTYLVHLIQHIFNSLAGESNLEAKAILPSPCALGNRLENLSIQALNFLKPQVQDASKTIIGVTLDVWTEIHTTVSYLGVSCHYNHNGEKRNIILGLRQLFGSINYENLWHELQTVLEIWGIRNKKENIVFVTDRGSAIVKMLSNLNWINCQPHAIHNLVYLVKFSKKTYINLPSTLKQEVSTRWSSIKISLQSIQNNLPYLREELQNRSQLMLLENIEEDGILNNLLEFLKPFEDATKELEADNKPTLYLASVWHKKLEVHLNSPAPIFFIEMYRAGRKYLEGLKLKNLAIISTYLHPNYRNLMMISDTSFSIDTAIKKLPFEFLKSHQTVNLPSTSQTSYRFSSYKDDTSHHENYLNEEWLRYKMMAVTDDIEDVQKWWWEQRLNFPRISKLSMGLHAVPASSASCERLFSSVKNIMGNRRTKLLPENLQIIAMVHGNARILPLHF